MLVSSSSRLSLFIKSPVIPTNIFLILKSFAYFFICTQNFCSLLLAILKSYLLFLNSTSSLKCVSVRCTNIAASVSSLYFLTLRFVLSFLRSFIISLLYPSKAFSIRAYSLKDLFCILLRSLSFCACLESFTLLSTISLSDIFQISTSLTLFLK